MAMTRLQKVARKAALSLLSAGAKGRCPLVGYQRQQFVKAFNALQRLAGKTTVARGAGLAKDRTRR